MTHIDDELRLLDEAARDGRAWADFKTRLSAAVDTEISRSYARNLSANDPTLASVKAAHQLIYVADRIRKAAIRAGRPIPRDLHQASEDVLAKAHRGSKDTNARLIEEERYAIGARVSWHKILKRKNVARARVSAAGPESHSSLQQQIFARTGELAMLIDQRAGEDLDLDELLVPLKACLVDVRERLECRRVCRLNPDAGTSPR